MDRIRNNSAEISPARRGQIIQRVLVDGWSPAQAGLAFGIAERRVARWVAAYRRYGMASLRGESECSLPGWFAAARALLASWSGATRRVFGIDLPAACADRNQQRDDRRLQ